MDASDAHKANFLFKHTLQKDSSGNVIGMDSFTNYVSGDTLFNCNQRDNIYGCSKLKIN